MTPGEQHALALAALGHAAFKLETAARLDQKLQTGENLNGDEVDAREGAALDLDEMMMVAAVLRKVCYLDVRDVKIDALYADQKEAEALQWEAVMDYQTMIHRDADGAPKVPEAARQLWLALSQDCRFVIVLVDYYKCACGMSRAAALREAAKVLRRPIESVTRQYARKSPKRGSPKRGSPK